MEIAVLKHPDELAINVQGVAADLKCSRTVLYNYGFASKIKTAAQEQIKNARKSGRLIEKDAFKSVISDYRDDLKKERIKVENLQSRILLMEANCYRLGIDPEELTKEPIKPDRTVSKAGIRR
ncbi:MAG: hypothetical protein ACR2N3_05090 [Pyrinomonadaceae bacterium]